MSKFLKESKKRSKIYKNLLSNVNSLAKSDLIKLNKELSKLKNEYKKVLKKRKK